MWIWSVMAWAMNPEFPQAAVCEWPTAITYGVWHGDVFDDPEERDGVHQVRASCGAAWLGEGWFVTAGHCTDPGFVFGTFGEVVRFGNHTNNSDFIWEAVVDFCEVHPDGAWNEDHDMWVGPDIAICRVQGTNFPYVPWVPLLVPGSCENDYLRHQLFSVPESSWPSSFPHSPYGSGVAAVEITVAGSGMESLWSDIADDDCNLKWSDCDNGNKREARSYLFHELNPVHEGVPTRNVPFVHRRIEEDYVAALDYWNDWPESADPPSIDVLNGGDSGSPMFVEMPDGTWRVIGVASARGSYGSQFDFVGREYDPDTNTTTEESYLFTGFAPAPIYLPWMEQVVEANDPLADITPCHDRSGNTYTYDYDLKCALVTAMMTTNPESNHVANNGAECFLDIGGDDEPETRECAGWDRPVTFPRAATPTQAELFADFAMTGTTRQPAEPMLFDLGPEGTIYGTSADDVITRTLPDAVTTVSLGAGNDTASLIRTSTGEIQVVGGAGNDIISTSGSTADLVLPGSGLDHATLGNGNDTLVVMGGCELAAGETFEGGSGLDVLVAPLSACDLARRGVAATGFERWVRTTAVSDSAMCRTPGWAPPLLTRPTTQQQQVITALCGP